MKKYFFTNLYLYSNKHPLTITSTDMTHLQDPLKSHRLGPKILSL